MTDTKTLSSALLTERLQETQQELADANGRLGQAVATGGDEQSIRDEIVDLESTLVGLTHALPIATACERIVAEELAAARAAQHRLDQNARREARLEAAQRVDDALAELGAAYRDLTTTPTGGAPADARRIAQRMDQNLKCAIHHGAPELADALALGRPRTRASIRPLKDSEAITIGELEQ